MTNILRVLPLKSPGETNRIAQLIGSILQKGDVVLLEGEIGAGKTHFARALIQSLQDTPEDVPSPTFTLIQTYDTQKGLIWHTDLYRLSAPEELNELGLIDAFETDICLVEWPDRLGNAHPRSALWLKFAVTDDMHSRDLEITSSDKDWNQRLEGIA